MKGVKTKSRVTARHAWRIIRSWGGQQSRCTRFSNENSSLACFDAWTTSQSVCRKESDVSELRFCCCTNGWFQARHALYKLAVSCVTCTKRYFNFKHTFVLFGRCHVPITEWCVPISEECVLIYQLNDATCTLLLIRMQSSMCRPCML